MGSEHWLKLQRSLQCNQHTLTLDPDLLTRIGSETKEPYRLAGGRATPLSSLWLIFIATVVLDSWVVAPVINIKAESLQPQITATVREVTVI